MCCFADFLGNLLESKCFDSLTFVNTNVKNTNIHCINFRPRRYTQFKSQGLLYIEVLVKSYLPCHQLARWQGLCWWWVTEKCKMEECLVNILPELQERIFNFCERTDLINLLVACTNSSNYHSVADIIKETLWKSVTIPTRVLRKGKLSSSSSNKKKLKNLRCTQTLHIRGGGCEEGISDLNNNRVTDTHVKEFSKVFEYCEPLVLLSVCIGGSLVNDANLTALTNRTTRLKKLELIGSAGATSISLQLHVLRYQFLEVGKVRKLCFQNSTTH